MRHKEFFEFAHKRHDIWLKRFRDRKPPPWTDDEILRNYSFTNIYRELDKTTIWFKENIRDVYCDDARASIFSTIAFRWFNRIETGKIILPFFHPDMWNREKVKKILVNRKPLTTGSYRIRTPRGMSNLDGLLFLIQSILDDLDNLTENLINAKTIQEATSHLVKYKYLGSFMAYEIATDLRHTCVLNDATDINEWANPGPGSRRGLARLMNKDKDAFDETEEEELVLLMQKLLKLSRDNWKEDHFSPAWEMREVEHTLCEWDKHERKLHGEGRLRNRFYEEQRT